MKKTKIILFTLFIGAILFGCASIPISQKYPERWEKTNIGMSLEEFKQVWPQARFMYPIRDGTTGQIYDSWTVIETPLIGEAQMISFYFQDNKLTSFLERGTGYRQP